MFDHLRRLSLVNLVNERIIGLNNIEVNHTYLKILPQLINLWQQKRKEITIPRTGEKDYSPSYLKQKQEPGKILIFFC